jgi:carboxyl-terminal processing protease
MPVKARSVLAIIVGVALGLGIALASGWLAGRQLERGDLAAGNSERVALLLEVIDRVQREYVETVDERMLVDAAIRGIVGELDDHSRYLDSRQYEEIRISTSGNYSGVGLDVSLENGRLKVVAPLDGTPAQAAGIQPGDVLLSVDDVPVDQHSIEDTVTRMRGSPGTQVTLDVQRPGSADPMRFALTRADIRVKTVIAEPLGDGYAYIKVSGFADATAAHLAEAVENLKAVVATDLKGAVFDLRSNPGGVLDGAVDVADAFLERGLIVRGSGQANESKFERHASAGDLLAGVPLVVLVDSSSASASEIVAGALKDHGRARIVGERTFGKGSVQTVVPLAGGGALKLTTSRYLTPSGRVINGHGIEPDLVVQSDDASRRYRGAGSGVSPSDDRQLQEALRLLAYDPIALSAVP